jgi:hypothetical protein
MMAYGTKHKTAISNEMSNSRKYLVVELVCRRLDYMKVCNGPSKTAQAISKLKIVE